MSVKDGFGDKGGNGGGRNGGGDDQSARFLQLGFTAKKHCPNFYDVSSARRFDDVRRFDRRVYRFSDQRRTRMATVRSSRFRFGFRRRSF